MVVRPGLGKWGQTLADPRVLAVEAEDARGREQLLALQRPASTQVFEDEDAAARGEGRRAHA